MSKILFVVDEEVFLTGIECLFKKVGLDNFAFITSNALLLTGDVKVLDYTVLITDFSSGIQDAKDYLKYSLLREYKYKFAFVNKEHNYLICKIEKEGARVIQRSISADELLSFFQKLHKLNNGTEIDNSITSEIGLRQVIGCDRFNLFEQIATDLTTAEESVLVKYCEDKSYSLIADELNISKKTVSTHLDNIRWKISNYTDIKLSENKQILNEVLKVNSNFKMAKKLFFKTNFSISKQK